MVTIFHVSVYMYRMFPNTCMGRNIKSDFAVVLIMISILMKDSAFIFENRDFYYTYFKFTSLMETAFWCFSDFNISEGFMMDWAKMWKFLLFFDDEKMYMILQVVLNIWWADNLNFCQMAKIKLSPTFLLNADSYVNMTRCRLWLRKLTTLIISCIVSDMEVNTLMQVTSMSLKLLQEIVWVEMPYILTWTTVLLSSVIRVWMNYLIFMRVFYSITIT